MTLKGENATEVWDPDKEDSQSPEYPRANKLILKQVLLGVEAKSDEYNVLEVKLCERNMSHTCR